MQSPKQPSTSTLGRASAANRPTGTKPFEIIVVCLGNICRSPMGEKVLQRAVAQAGLDGQVTVSSAGTGDWHVGADAHRLTQQILAESGYPTTHTARQITPQLLADAGLVLAADRSNYHALCELASNPSKVRMLRSFDPAAESEEIPDPYGYGPDAFREVLAMIQASAPGVIAAVRNQLAEPPQ